MNSKQTKIKKYIFFGFRPRLWFQFQASWAFRLTVAQLLLVHKKGSLRVNVRVLIYWCKGKEEIAHHSAHCDPAVTHSASLIQAIYWSFCERISWCSLMCCDGQFDECDGDVLWEIPHSVHIQLWWMRNHSLSQILHILFRLMTNIFQCP